LTIKKDNDGTPTNFGTTDTCILQPHDDDATNLTYLGHVVEILGNGDIGSPL